MATTEETATATKPVNNKNLTWKCKCGEFQIKLTGEPFGVANCHCKSCVTAGKHITEQYGSNGTSIIDDTGGACGAFYKFENMDFPDISSGNDDTTVGHAKIGDTGTNVRSYTKCCGTQITMAGGKSFFLGYFRPLNRNALYEEDEDGTTKPYKPSEEPVNTMCMEAFDPAAIPEPKYKLAPLTFVVGQVAPLFFKKVVGWEKNEKYPDHPVLMVDAANVTDVIPKTW